MELLEILSCDTDISEGLKDEFTIYIQKVSLFDLTNLNQKIRYF